MNLSKKYRRKWPFFYHRSFGSVGLLGGMIFFIGCLGISWNSWQKYQSSLAQIFPQSSSLIFQMSLKQANALDESTSQNNVSIRSSAESILERFLGDYFYIPFRSITPWMKDKIGFALLPEDQFLVAIEIENKIEAERFIHSYLLAGETLAQMEINGHQIFTPEYSSAMSFSFYRGWLLIGNDTASLESVLGSEAVAFRHHPQYRKVKSDIIRPRSFFTLFVESQSILENVDRYEFINAQLPIFEILSQAIPFFGMSAYVENNALHFASKFVIHEGVFDDNKLARSGKKVIPDLAQFATKDALFFINGIDLANKYAHTKDFLQEIHPQFALVFDGILRSQMENIFGEEFDFENDFLKKLYGQYAILLDFDNDVLPFVSMTIISEYGGVDQEASLKDFQEALRFAQSRTNPLLETRINNEGIQREELVAQDVSSIEVHKVPFSEQHSYYTLGEEDNLQNFSYGWIDNYFVFSTHESGMKSILSTFTKQQSSLIENKNFRESVLYDFSLSESYSFINVSKFVRTMEYLLGSDAESDGHAIKNFLLRHVRNIVIARKIFKGELYFSARFFLR